MIEATISHEMPQDRFVLTPKLNDNLHNMSTSIERRDTQTSTQTIDVAIDQMTRQGYYQ